MVEMLKTGISSTGTDGELTVFLSLNKYTDWRADLLKVLSR